MPSEQTSDMPSARSRSAGNVKITTVAPTTKKLVGIMNMRGVNESVNGSVNGNLSEDTIVALVRRIARIHARQIGTSLRDFEYYSYLRNSGRISFNCLRVSHPTMASNSIHCARVYNSIVTV